MMKTKANFWVNSDDDFLMRAQEVNRITLYTSGDCQQFIPRIAHFIWLGSAALPKYATACMERFQSLHPSWQMKLWDDSTVSSLQWTGNKDIFMTSSNMGM